MNEPPLSGIEPLSTGVRRTSDASFLTVGNRPKNVVSQIWGFDPLELLESVDFPNDRYERLLRISKEARLLAIRRLDIPLSDDESLRQSASKESLNNMVLSSNLSLVAVAPPTTADERVEKVLLREQLARSAASILIQSAFRGWLTRMKYIAVVYFALTRKSISSGAEKVTAGLPGVEDLSIQERLIRKFMNYCRSFERLHRPMPDFPQFCAALIQSLFRMKVARRSFLRIKLMTMDEKLGSAGLEARQELQRLVLRSDIRMNSWNSAAIKIQRAWRKFYAVKIYRFYRELIRFRERGDPRKLLRFVNPKEAQLIDGACGIHVRFRLGGTSFPPTIYYKIFIHSRLIDMNAFSPRDYTKEMKQLPPRVLFAKNGPPIPPSEPANGGWYKRFENNGWRPVSDRVWDERTDEITQNSKKTTIPFHFSKLKRKHEVERARKEKKLAWLRTIYSEGKKKYNHTVAMETGISDIDGLIVEGMDQGNTSDKVPKPLERLETPSMTSEEEITKAIAELQRELDDDDAMIRWTRALDFEDYVSTWMCISTTGQSDDPKFYGNDMDSIGERYGVSFTRSFHCGQELLDVSSGFETNLAAVELHPSQSQDNVTTANDPMLAEIDLFRKISEEAATAAETNILGESRYSTMSEGTKDRPWSGRSGRSSMKDLFLSGDDQVDF